MKDYLEPREWKARDFSGMGASLEQKVQELRQETGFSGLTLRVCLLRGLDSPQAIREHLSPRLEALTNPFQIRDMEVAVHRLSRARAAGELLSVFGDYDVDGTTGAALLSWV